MASITKNCAAADMAAEIMVVVTVARAIVAPPRVVKKVTPAMIPPSMRALFQSKGGVAVGAEGAASTDRVFVKRVSCCLFLPKGERVIEDFFFSVMNFTATAMASFSIKTYQ